MTIRITRVLNTNDSDWEEQQAKRIQTLFEKFVSIRSEQLESLISAESFRNDESLNANWLKRYVLEILIKNDNLYTIADYIRQGGTKYYWSSNFLDNLEKEDRKKYYFYDTSNVIVSRSKFDKTLHAVDLPYFKDVVELVSTLKAIERLEPKETELPEHKETKPTFKSSLTPAQLHKLAETINNIKLFKDSITSEKLAELLSGDRTEKLQTSSTKLLYYLFEKLSRNKYITLDWWDIFLRNAILFSVRGNVIENQDFRGAKQKVFGEYEGILPKKYHIIDDCLDEIDNLRDTEKME